MKSQFVLPLVLLAVIAAAILFEHKTSKTEAEKNIDNLASGLNGIDNFLPLQAKVSLKYEEVNTDVYLWLRYLLAPRYVSVNQQEQFDTSLILCRADASDSLIHSLTFHKNIIWFNKDKQYNYYLASNLPQ